MSTQGSPSNKKKPKKTPPPANDFPRGGDQGRGPKQKIDRAHPVSGARRVNRPQGR